MKLFAAVLLCMMSSVLYGQLAISEDDVDFKILKWHFNNYPKSETISWYEMGEGSYKVNFTYENHTISTVYLSSGEKLSEEIDLIKELPITITYYLEERYDKFKVLSYVRFTKFETAETFYSLVLKPKNGKEISLRFDQDLIPMK